MTLETPQDKLIGQTLGQYQIESKLGSGGMATVYLAHQTSIGRYVAIKVLPAHFLHDPSFLKRFQMEVQIIARLQHPRILPVYDYGMHDGSPYIVMAYLPGGTLTERILEGPMALGEVVSVMEAVAQGLDHAHAEGIVHRDFKPSNVLLDKGGNPYLADFGIAKISEGTLAMTGSGIIGTPAYIAPEMASEGIAGPPADIYALGISTFQMLTGRLPFEFETPMRTMMAHISDPPPDVREFRPDVPAGITRVLNKALAKEPGDRYKTARAFASALRAASGIAVEQEEMFTDTVPSVDGAISPSAGFTAPPTDIIKAKPADRTMRENFAPPVDTASAPPRERSRVAFPIVAALIGLLVLGGIGAGGFFLYQQGFFTGGGSDDPATTSADTGIGSTQTAQAASSANTQQAATATGIVNATASANAASTTVAQVGGESATSTAIIVQQTQAALDAEATATSEAANEAATAAAENSSSATEQARATVLFNNYQEVLTSVQQGAYEDNVLALIGTIDSMPIDYTGSFAIQHNPSVTPLIEYAPGDDYVDFMAKAVFTSPFTTRDGLWDIGIIFRSADNGSNDFQYRLRYDAVNSWGLESRRGADIRPLASTNGGWFDTSDNGSNELVLIVVDQRAYVVLNGHFIQKVDIFELNPIGSIGVGIGFAPQKQLNGKTTPIDLTIWRLP